VLKEFYPAIAFYGWFAIYAPPGTPDAIIRRFSDELNKVAADKDLNAQFLKLALRPNPSSPEELAESTRADHAYYGKLIRELNLKME